MRESLGDIAKEIEATGKPKRMRVRRLLAIVGQERRGKNVTRAIRRLLRLVAEQSGATTRRRAHGRFPWPRTGAANREARLEDAFEA